MSGIFVSLSLWYFQCPNHTDCSPATSTYICKVPWDGADY